MGHESPLINTYIDLTVRVDKVRNLCQTGITAFNNPLDLALAILDILELSDERRPD